MPKNFNVLREQMEKRKVNRAEIQVKDFSDYQLKSKLIQWGWMDASGKMLTWKYWHDKYDLDKVYFDER